jgi:hypothetical protein
MIEEAVGTMMYETKKQQAQRTIEKKDAKLREINDVSFGLFDSFNACFTRVCTYVQRGSKFCFVVLLADTFYSEYYIIVQFHHAFSILQLCPAAFHKYYNFFV